MHSDLSPLDKLFRDAAEQVEQEPVEGNWGKMMQKLAKENDKGKRKFIAWWLIGSGIIVLSSVLILLYIYINTGDIPVITNNDIAVSHVKIISPESKDTVQVAVKTVAPVMEEQNTHTIAVRPTEPAYIPANTPVQVPAKIVAPPVVQSGTTFYKVQIGAFKKRPDNSLFSNLKDVIEEQKDGYYKYYAGVYTNENKAIAKQKEVKSMGFDVYVITDNEPLIQLLSENKVFDTANADNKKKENTVIFQNIIPGKKTAKEINQPYRQEISINSQNKTKSPDSIKTNNTNNSKAVVANPLTTGDNGEKTDNNIALSKWGIGASCSYDVNHFRMVSQNDDGTYLLNNNSSLLKGGNNFEYSFGLQGIYRISKKIAIELGINYSQKKELQVSNLTYNDVVDYTFVFNGKYIDVPIRLKYYFLDKNVPLFVASGVVLSSNFPAGNKSYFLLKRTLVSYYVEDLTMLPNSIGTSLQFGAGGEYDLTRRWKLYINSFYTYSLSPVLKNPTYKNVPVKHYINSIDFGAGCYYNF